MSVQIGQLPTARYANSLQRVAFSNEDIRRVAQEIESMTDQSRQNNLAAATGILAGLVLDKEVIRRLLRRELMRESVIYQELWQEAREEGLQEGREEAKLTGTRTTIAVPPPG